MKFIELFEDFKKHKGPRAYPQNVYHKSNPIFRETIENEGLKCMKGDSYSTYSPGVEEIPAIFGYTGEIDYYDSTFDDDVWLIHINDDIEWYIDLAIGDNHFVTYRNIPRDHIKIEYRGSGKSSF